MTAHRSFLLLVLASMLGVATVSGAQPQARHDSNAPIDFDADHMEVHDREHRAVLVGNVRAVQQDMTMTADRVTANYTGSAGSGTQPSPSNANSSLKVHRLDANGHVVVTRPAEIAHGDFGIYDLDKRIVTLLGKVTLDRTGPNASTVRGGRLIIDLNTNRANMDGSNVGGEGTTGKGGRVSGRFIVPQHDDNSAASANQSSGN